MDLVFFDACLQHLLRILRVLRQPRGNAMLIGVGGSGKQTLTKLGTFVLGYEVFTVMIVKGRQKTEAAVKKYLIDEFRKKIKELVVETGVNQNPKTFLVTDATIQDSAYLEDINNLLNSGEIPNLFTEEEKTEAFKDLPDPITGKKPMEGPTEEKWARLITNERANLHVCICMSPIGNVLRLRCQKFPSLVNCCTLDWYSNWPDEALMSVSYKKMVDLKLPSDEIKKSLSIICKDIHQSARTTALKFEAQMQRHVYCTSKTFLDFIELYQTIINQQREIIGRRRKRLIIGVDKIATTNTMVDGLKKQLIEAQPELEEAQKLLIVKKAQVEKESVEANKQAEVVQIEQEKVMTKAAEINEKNAEAKSEVDKVQPMLDAVAEKMKNVNEKALSTIAGYNQVSDTIKYLFKTLAAFPYFTKKFSVKYKADKAW